MSEPLPDLRRLARAAGLEIPAQERAAFERRLQGMLEWIAVLEREDPVPETEEPVEQTRRAPGDRAAGQPPAGRDPSLDETLALEVLRALAPHWVDDAFGVPRVHGELP